MALGESLTNLLSDAGFKLVDIGARGGSMEELALLAPFSHYYACEPDPVEARKLSTKLKDENRWRDLTLMPEAISSNEGEATLNITKHLGLSSLLKPNYDLIKRFYTDPVFRIESTVNIPTISLKNASELYSFQDACFLKVDTQGTELDILKSGSLFVEENIMGVYVEVEFHPFYKDQPLFSDVDSYLTGLGFSLFDLHRVLMRRAAYQSNLYSRRQVVWAHALYFKEPESILRGNDDNKTLLNVMRLLGLALAFEQFDMALELVTSGRSSMLISNAYGLQVKNDVGDFIQRKTDDLLDKANFDESLPNCTTQMYQDKKNILRHQHYQTFRSFERLKQKYADLNKKYTNLGESYTKLGEKFTKLRKKLMNLNKKLPIHKKSITVAIESMIRNFLGKDPYK